ncbi:MAG TPA: hypothetical protein VHO71_04830, partial [Caproiciproducens sp.]|nr:hypothetical protein [Caproiciproducens sp.]
KCKAAADNATNLAAGFDEEIQDLRQKCIVTASQEFNPADGVCPTCGQEYPPEKLHDLEESFKENNARRLDRLEQKGKSLRKSKDDMLAAVEENKQKITADEQSLKQAEARLEQVSKAFTNPPPFESTTEYKKLHVSLTTAQSDLTAVESSTANQIEKFNSQLDEVTEKIAAIKQRMAARSIAEQQDKRIEELKKQERELSELLATYDKGLLLAEKFVQTKALDIEHKVNSAFRLVRWKLFDIQVNGGIKACCEATVKGIEYNKNLNSAGKLNAGLDIINTLSRTVGISVPVWIDNAESVTRYFPIGAQVIRLHVSAKDKQLRVEVRG